MAITREGLGIIVVIATSIIFGLYPTAARAIYAHGGNAAFIIMFTLFCRATLLAGFCVTRRMPLFRSRADTRVAAVNGVYQFASAACVLGAMAYLPGPVVITVMFSYTALLYLFMAARGEEAFHPIVLAAVLAALAGLALVLDVFNAAARPSLIGIALAGMTPIIAAARIYVFGRQLKSRAPAVVGAETFVFALGFALLMPFFNTPALPTDAVGWAWALAAGLSLAVGTFGVFYGIAMLGSFRFSFISKLEPVFGAIIAATLINEVLSPTQYAGMALVLGGLVAYQVLERRQKQKTP